MKKLILVAAAVLICAGVGLTIAATAPTEPITIATEGAKRDPVTFDHAKHADLKCEQCHHNGLDEPKCGVCHTVEGKDGVSKAQDAMHARTTGACRSCHFDDGAQKLRCGDCHKK
ncbi:MAG: cytochrome c3 family protein [Deferrisomatales bacterium]|nr:cytochrome c3 family protein [Deferrisomatales bacterium]